jgi:hypothetical protein
MWKKLKLVALIIWVCIKFAVKKISAFLLEEVYEQIYVDGKKHWKESASKLLAFVLAYVVIWGYYLKYTGCPYVTTGDLGISSGLVSIIFATLKWSKETGEKNTADNVSFRPNAVQTDGFMDTIKNVISTNNINVSATANTVETMISNTTTDIKQ